MQLDKQSFANNTARLPGLDIRLSGNVVDSGRRSFTFAKDQKLHGSWYYRLTYDFDGVDLNDEEPELRIEVETTDPPRYPLQVDF
jgi:hypothetical protein